MGIQICSIKHETCLVYIEVKISKKECISFSENCFVFLTGNRGDYELDVGPKVILVASGGTLELNGQEKLSWTKLNKTVTKVDNSEALLYDHMVSII